MAANQQDVLNEIGVLSASISTDETTSDNALAAEKAAHAADLATRDALEADLKAKLDAGAVQQDTQPVIDALKAVEAKIAARNAATTTPTNTTPATDTTPSTPAPPDTSSPAATTDSGTNSTDTTTSGTTDTSATDSTTPSA